MNDKNGHNNTNNLDYLHHSLGRKCSFKGNTYDENGEALRTKTKGNVVDKTGPKRVVVRT